MTKIYTTIYLSDCRRDCDGKEYTLTKKNRFNGLLLCVTHPV